VGHCLHRPVCMGFQGETMLLIIPKIQGLNHAGFGINLAAV